MGSRAPRIALAAAVWSLSLSCVDPEGPADPPDEADCDASDERALADAFLRIDGDETYNLSGKSVASIEDIDGDGRPELLIGVSNIEQSRGRSYLFFSEGLVAGGDRKLADADVVLSGGAPGEASGRHVASAGDVDGDGLGDLLVGAHNADDVAGFAALFFGADVANGGSFELTEARVTLRGNADYDHAGWTVASAGDVDGDGLDDVLVGAYGDDSAGDDAGTAAVFFASTLLAESELTLAQGDVVFVGGPGDALGRTGASLGDLDGDGRDDLLVGALGHDGGGTDAGAAFVYLAADVAGGGVFPPSAAHATLLGEAAGDGVGFALAGPGDVDGDGIGDALIAAYRSDRGGPNAGAVYVVVSQQLAAGGSLSLADAHSTLLGEACQPSDLAGWSVGGAGDVDGDGLADLIVGAMWNDDGGFDSGKAYVVAGSTVAAGGVLSLADAEASYIGANTTRPNLEVPFLHDQSGESVGSAGDLDGDGLDDVFVSAPDHLGGRGRTYVLLSRDR